MLKRRLLTLSLLVPLLLLLFLSAGKGAKEHASFFLKKADTPSKVFPTDAENATKSILYTVFTLSFPDAIVSSAVSFQAHFTEGICIFLLALFLRYQCIEIHSAFTAFFIYSYFRKLFGSLILINAP
ncbi:hypothetical protein GXP67_11535 [Rhodocytophaga rosea]|uniref:Uncharacterized protein n=1 Tax=Rhodocytophaga rosea TaxID=2704465 RepID=A0A6C0GGU1_9BACT|nr:hypothetical protein [Rhodocytophaga rosea]QHT67226.1 hypothetical protein GXP67_11535 [Rhodocytophaga rosea]